MLSACSLRIQNTSESKVHCEVSNNTPVIQTPPESQGNSDVSDNTPVIQNELTLNKFYAILNSNKLLDYDFSQITSGMVSRYLQSNYLIWENNEIVDIVTHLNHSVMEVVEPIEDLTAPALLVHGNHDLYTAGDLGRLDESGVDLTKLETTSDYWYLFIANPDSEYVMWLV